MTDITLREINKDNWREATKLNVSDDQQNFVAPNWYSIIEALFEPELYSYGIYAGDDMVGYVMCGLDADDTGEYWIVRLMTDKTHQNKGYGRTALHKIIDMMHEKFNCHIIFLSFEPENHIAKKFYESVGFVDTGRVEHGEIVYRLDLNK